MFYFIQNGGKLKRNVSADIDWKIVDYSSRNNIFRLNITLKLDSGVVGFLMRMGSSLYYKINIAVPAIAHLCPHRPKKCLPEI